MYQDRQDVSVWFMLCQNWLADWCTCDTSPRTFVFTISSRNIVCIIRSTPFNRRLIGWFLDGPTLSKKVIRYDVKMNLSYLSNVVISVAVQRHRRAMFDDRTSPHTFLLSSKVPSCPLTIRINPDRRYPASTNANGYWSSKWRPYTCRRTNDRAQIFLKRKVVRYLKNRNWRSTYFKVVMTEGWFVSKTGAGSGSRKIGCAVEVRARSRAPDFCAVGGHVWRKPRAGRSRTAGAGWRTPAVGSPHLGLEGARGGAPFRIHWEFAAKREWWEKIWKVLKRTIYAFLSYRDVSYMYTK